MDSKLNFDLAEEQGGRADSKLRLALWFGGAGTGLLQAWAFRHIVNPDGIPYLDTASAVAWGDWHSLVNGYWSPLYPFLLGVTFRILKPSLYWESTVAHFVNFGIFIVAFLRFEAFLEALIGSLRLGGPAPNGREPLPEFFGSSLVLSLRNAALSRIVWRAILRRMNQSD